MHPLEPKKRFYTNIDPENLNNYQLYFECEFFDQNPPKNTINNFQKSVSLKWKALKLFPEKLPSKSDLLHQLNAKIQTHKSLLEQKKLKKH